MHTAGDFLLVLPVMNRDFFSWFGRLLRSWNLLNLHDPSQHCESLY